MSILRVTGLFLAEDTLIPGDRHSLADVSNAQVFVQKVDGMFQFFIQAGVYSLPSLGAGYLTAGNATTDLYGPMPQAFVKFAPTSAFSIEAGARRSRSPLPARPARSGRRKGTGRTGSCPRSRCPARPPCAARPGSAAGYARRQRTRRSRRAG